MPLVYTDDVVNIFQQSKKKYLNTISKEKKNDFKWNLDGYTELLKAISIKIEQFNTEVQNQELRAISANTLHKKLHYDLFKDSVGEDCRYEENTLNVLCYYAYEQLYRHRFIILNRTPQHLSSEKQQLNKDIIAEFPVGDPSYPATPTIEVNVPRFKNVFIKCENQNYTGTHKDRMAYKVALFYPEYVRSIKRSTLLPSNPVFSLITSGCSGIAIQTLFRAMNYPNLRVIIDENINPNIELALENAGCVIYKQNLREHELNSEDILRITENNYGDGFDLTFTEEIEHVQLRYYDWLSFEIINQQPDYIFVPYGSGDLIVNIMRRIESELNGIRVHKLDRRLHVDILPFKECRIYGATTTNPNSSMDKLYSPFFSENNYRAVEELFEKQNVHPDSRLVEVKEESVNTAMQIADENSIGCEPSGIAGLSLLFQMEKELVEKDAEIYSKKILVINTGRLKVELFDTKEKAKEYNDWLRKKMIKRNQKAKKKK